VLTKEAVNVFIPDFVARLRAVLNRRAIELGKRQKAQPNAAGEQSYMDSRASSTVRIPQSSRTQIVAAA
jgi:hypothetical protein